MKRKKEKQLQPILREHVITPSGVRLRSISVPPDSRFEYILNTILTDKKKEEQAGVQWVQGMRNQLDVTPAMRMVLLDWLVAVTHERRLRTITLFQAVATIDQVLFKAQIPRTKFQELGTAAMFLAAQNLEPLNSPDLETFSELTASSSSEDDIIKMSERILELNFGKCVNVTTHCILTKIIPALELEHEQARLAVVRCFCLILTPKVLV